MTYGQWEAQVPACISEDALWKMAAYRRALFLFDLAWHDLERLRDERRLVGLSDQLYRAVGSIGANISEGFSRSSPRDRVRLYEYTLSSARESGDGISAADTAWALTCSNTGVSSLRRSSNCS